MAEESYYSEIAKLWLEFLEDQVSAGNIRVYGDDLVYINQGNGCIGISVDGVFAEGRGWAAFKFAALDFGNKIAAQRGKTLNFKHTSESKISGRQFSMTLG